MDLSAFDVALQALSTQVVKLVGILIVGYGLMSIAELIKAWWRT